MDRLPMALAIILAAVVPALAEDHQPLPDQLNFGYEEEGKIDASPAGCEAFVKEVVEWSEAEMQRGIREVCAARKQHVEAYAAIQKSYKLLAAQVREETRLEQAASVKAIEAMVKACIDHKSGLTPGGHNISADIIPNDIAARCLDIGRKVLDDETSWLTTDPEKHVHFSP
jgi:hypothetical protein